MIFDYVMLVILKLTGYIYKMMMLDRNTNPEKEPPSPNTLTAKYWVSVNLETSKDCDLKKRVVQYIINVISELSEPSVYIILYVVGHH